MSVDRRGLIRRTIRERTHGDPPDRASLSGSDEKWSGYLLGVEEASAVAADQLREAVEALAEAVAAARTFNRSGMTWLEYDAALVRFELIANGGQ